MRFYLPIVLQIEPEVTPCGNSRIGEADSSVVTDQEKRGRHFRSSRLRSGAEKFKAMLGDLGPVGIGTETKLALSFDGKAVWKARGRLEDIVRLKSKNHFRKTIGGDVPSVLLPDLIFPDNFNTAKAMQRRVARADDLIENDEQIHGSYSSLRVILSNTSREAGGRVKETNRAPCLVVRSRRPCSREESRLWK